MLTKFLPVVLYKSEFAPQHEFEIPVFKLKLFPMHTPDVFVWQPIPMVTELTPGTLPLPSEILLKLPL